jgi:hypothetical protein
MFARVSTVEMPVDKGEAATKAFREQVIPNVKEMEGFQHAYLLADKRTGKAHAVFLFDTEDSLRASSERAGEIRKRVIESFGGKVVAIEEMEVVAES